MARKVKIPFSKERLKQVMAAKGFTNQKLGDQLFDETYSPLTRKTNVSHMIMDQEATPQTLDKIGKILNVSPLWLQGKITVKDHFTKEEKKGSFPPYSWDQTADYKQSLKDEMERLLLVTGFDDFSRLATEAGFLGFPDENGNITRDDLKGLKQPVFTDIQSAVSQPIELQRYLTHCLLKWYRAHGLITEGPAAETEQKEGK